METFKIFLPENVLGNPIFLKVATKNIFLRSFLNTHPGTETLNLGRKADLHLSFVEGNLTKG